MNKYSSPGWVCPVCGDVVTVTEKDEVGPYDYKCPACGEITGADKWKERLNAEWIAHKNSYRLYAPSFPQNTVAYVDDLSEVDKNNYDVVLCDMNATVKGHACNGKEFEDTLNFVMLPPKEGEKHYGTGYYMLVEQMNAELPPQKHYVDVRYERTTDVEILADRWIKNFYGKNAEDIRKEFP